MEQASACHCCMALWVATLATLVGISHSSAKRCKQRPKTTGHDGKGKRKPQTDNFGPPKNHDQTTLEAKSVDFSTSWCMKGTLTVACENIMTDSRESFVPRGVERRAEKKYWPGVYAPSIMQLVF